MRPDITTTRRLVYCPVCLIKGVKNVLGEKIRNGFIIKRFHRSETIMFSQEFAIVCGECSELVFFQKENI